MACKEIHLVRVLGNESVDVPLTHFRQTRRDESENVSLTHFRQTRFKLSVDTENESKVRPLTHPQTHLDAENESKVRSLTHRARQTRISADRRIA